MYIARFVALLGLVLLSACQSPKPIETASDLVNALKNKGIQYDSPEVIDLSGMGFAQVNEGVRITGNGLRAEILRVEDERTFKLVSSLGSLLKALNERFDDTPLNPPDVIARHPFVVVVRQEPEPGEIRRIVEQLLPQDSELNTANTLPSDHPLGRRHLEASGPPLVTAALDPLPCCGYFLV